MPAREHAYRPARERSAHSTLPVACSFGGTLLMERTAPWWGARSFRGAPATSYGPGGRARHHDRPAFQSGQSKIVEVPSVHATNILRAGTGSPPKTDSCWPSDKTN